MLLPGRRAQLESITNRITAAFFCLHSANAHDARPFTLISIYASTDNSNHTTTNNNNSEIIQPVSFMHNLIFAFSNRFVIPFYALSIIYVSLCTFLWYSKWSKWFFAWIGNKANAEPIWMGQKRIKLVYVIFASIAPFISSSSEFYLSFFHLPSNLHYLSIANTDFKW